MLKYLKEENIKRSIRLINIYYFLAREEFRRECHAHLCELIWEFFWEARHFEEGPTRATAPLAPASFESFPFFQGRCLFPILTRNKWKLVKCWKFPLLLYSGGFCLCCHCTDPEQSADLQSSPPADSSVTKTEARWPSPHGPAGTTISWTHRKCLKICYHISKWCTEFE